jgi:hypothetical protein
MALKRENSIVALALLSNGMAASIVAKSVKPNEISYIKRHEMIMAASEKRGGKTAIGKSKWRRKQRRNEESENMKKMESET